nr:MAG: hypothetical protein [Bacteriophage sp.]
MKKWQEVTEVHKRDCREVLEILGIKESTIKFIERRIDMAAMEAAHEQASSWLDEPLPGVLHRGKSAD